MTTDPGMRSIFFYGLFMDAGLLEKKALRPNVTGPAELPGYGLRVGERATLVEAVAETVYGVLIELPHNDVECLYSEPGVADYRAISVRVRLLEDGTMQPAECYVLPGTAGARAINTAYARELSILLRSLEFPAAYCRHVERLGTGQT